MELKNSVKSLFLTMLKNSAKGIPKGIGYLLIILMSNVIQQGFIIKMLGGVTQKEYKRYQWQIDKIEDGKMYRSDDLIEEKEVLRKKIHITGKGFIVIGALATGKYKGKYCSEKEGFMEIFIYVDDIECAHGSSYLGACRYRNDAKSSSIAAFDFKLIDDGDHEIKVVAVYYGSMERDETRFRYLTISEAHKIN